MNPRRSEQGNQWINMNNSIKSESGIDLLQRLAVRPKLSGLQVEIFGRNGPLPGDIIEINERGSCGKTLLLTQWIIKCILPSKWKEFTINGLNVGVVLISTDHHFMILHLVTLMERRLKRILRCQPGTGSAVVQEIIQDSLKRFSVFMSFSKSQLLFNFCSVKTYILSHPHSSVVVVDSLTAYYWEDRLMANIQSFEKYCSVLLKNLMEKLKQTNITIIYTTQLFLRENQEKDPELVNPYVYSLLLEKNPDFTVSVEDRRNATTTVKKVEMFKGELIFK